MEDDEDVPWTGQTPILKSHHSQVHLGNRQDGG